MSPIDRVSSRNHAFSTLGVSAMSTKEDIRQAYRRLAFEKHPDHHPERGDEFSEIAKAYQYICDNAEELGIREAPAPNPEPKTTRVVSRPTLKATEETFDAAATAECEACLEEEEIEGARHVASAVYRVGRSLTYFVPTPIGTGMNLVALPTGMLHDTRKTLPRVIAIDRSDALAGMFELSREECDEHFPGARQIQIRFASA